MISKGRSTKTQMEELLYPINGYRGNLIKKGIIPKNYQVENYKKIKEKHQNYIDNCEKTKESKKESKNINEKKGFLGLWKMQRFTKVDSVIGHSTWHEARTKPKEMPLESDKENIQQQLPEKLLCKDPMTAKQKKPPVPKSTDQLKLVNQ